MRQVFSSQRVETVEGVAKLLRETGIEVHISNGRSYQGKRTGQFSYRDKPNEKNQPAVWVVHANDQPAARGILRQARLLETTRSDHPTADYVFRDAPGAGNARSWGWKIRALLLLVIAAIVLFIVLRQPNPAPGASAPATPATTPAAAEEEDEIRVRIQPPQG